MMKSITHVFNFVSHNPKMTLGIGAIGGAAGLMMSTKAKNALTRTKAEAKQKAKRKAIQDEKAHNEAIWETFQKNKNLPPAEEALNVKPDLKTKKFGGAVAEKDQNLAGDDGKGGKKTGGAKKDGKNSGGAKKDG